MRANDDVAPPPSGVVEYPGQDAGQVGERHVVPKWSRQFRNRGADSLVDLVKAVLD
jgi:hypothetical protein